MKIETQQDTLLLTFTSDVLSTNVQSLRPQIMQSLEAAEGITKVEANLAEARIVDSMGFNLLIALFRECEKRHLGFRVTQPSPEVLRLIRFLNLHDRFGL